MAEVIAIDGPSASGKSTVARRVAAALGYVYVDSGAMYRAVTWAALRKGIALTDAEALAALARDGGVTVSVASGAVRLTVGGDDPGAALRSEEVTGNVSRVAAAPGVRAEVGRWLRGLRRFGDLVVEGRDIGSVVFADAAFKFYLDASAGERARRRHAETEGSGRSVGVGEVERALKRRDAIDRTRSAAPLRIASGAVTLDTTGMAIEEVVERILGEVRSRGA
jgi:cytidylate kinase